ncbi:MAG: 3-deoxy-D-manno-octulosonic acid transferase [Desulforhopalus sp.]
MFLFYNILQILFLPIALPFIFLFVLFSRKYRDRIPARLGYGLNREITTKRSPTFWIHALSVGEVTSALPLITGLRNKYSEATIIVSVTTRSGKLVADNLLKKTADHVIDGPLDVLPVVLYFISRIRPDFYILVETDFWPNLLLSLKKKKVPTLLVNGRVSLKSMEGYQKAGFFFKTMFASFSALAMQTERDKDNMIALGLNADKMHTLGNLKFDTQASPAVKHTSSRPQAIPEESILFICGSTHPGEEEILLDSYCRIRQGYPEVFMIIAPRDTNRAGGIQALGEERGLKTALRTATVMGQADLFILNTIGELIDFYALSDIAFVGGSLVKEGGHNPIEPAAMGIPVLFGPDMEDFSEISALLIEQGGGIQVTTQAELTEQLTRLIESSDIRQRCGQAAQNCIAAQRGVIGRHLELIQRSL